MALLRGGTSRVSEVWRRGHPWSFLYPRAVDHPRLAQPFAAVAFGTDMHLFEEATRPLAELAAGSVVLDVPCGGGVALRGLRPGQGVCYLAVDISTPMLGRTRAAAHRRGIDDQVSTLAADVGRLPLPEQSVDLAISLTGLHCFPDPRAAVLELGRVVRGGGALSLSWLRTDGGLRYAPVLTAGRAAGLLGPSAGVAEVERWLAQAGFADVTLVRSGALAYVSARRA